MFSWFAPNFCRPILKFTSTKRPWLITLANTVALLLSLPYVFFSIIIVITDTIRICPLYCLHLMSPTKTKALSNRELFCIPRPSRHSQHSGSYWVLLNKQMLLCIKITLAARTYVFQGPGKREHFPAGLMCHCLNYWKVKGETHEKQCSTPLHLFDTVIFHSFLHLTWT